MALNSIGTSGAAEINHVALCKSDKRPCGIRESQGGSERDSRTNANKGKAVALAIET